MTNDKKKPTAADVLDELSHHAALEAAENGKSTAADRRWSKELSKDVQARLAELRRGHTPADVPTEKAKPLRASTIAMGREALEKAFAALVRAMGGGMQLAYRNFTVMSDDDLRRLYDTIDPTNHDPE